MVQGVGFEEVHRKEGRSEATWNRELELSWREAGPPNHRDDEADSDQQVVNKLMSRLFLVPIRQLLAGHVDPERVQGLVTCCHFLPLSPSIALSRTPSDVRGRSSS